MTKKDGRDLSGECSIMVIRYHLCTGTLETPVSHHHPPSADPGESFHMDAVKKESGSGFKIVICLYVILSN